MNAQFKTLIGVDDATLAGMLRGVPTSALIGMLSSATAMMAVITSKHDLTGEALEAMTRETGIERFIIALSAEIDRRLPMPGEVS